jgi:molybdenum cofactor cytidylyltransferase
MELIRALRLDQIPSPPRVAFVGAGGKTTAMFQCARQLASSVLVTATTHLAVDQLGLADRHYFVDDRLLDRLESDLHPGLTLLTGPLAGDSNRALGVSADLLECIRALAEACCIPLLVEADGSRQLPLKAPADHEPPIPAFVDLVLVVAGLRGLGKPLTPEWVHRPEAFGAISGLQQGDVITPAALAQVMTHPDGGLKNIPSQARRVALLNQADTPELQAQAAAMKSELLPSFDALITGSLALKSSIPSLQSSIYTVHQPIAAVILAAGEARRFGRIKQLLDWHGKPLIWHVAQKALQAGLTPVVVVCGAQKDAIQGVLADLPVELINNSDWQGGQGISVRLGTQVVGARSDGILFLLADQPQIPVSLIRALVEAHARSLNPITGPMIDGHRASPVLFDQVTFDDLTSLSGEVGGRKLFAKYGVDWIPWHDPSSLLDVDTPEDYARLLEMEA